MLAVAVSLGLGEHGGVRKALKRFSGVCANVTDPRSLGERSANGVSDSG